MAPIACEGGASGSVRGEDVVQHVLVVKAECICVGVLSRTQQREMSWDSSKQEKTCGSDMRGVE